MKLTAAAITDTGKVREHNEDSFLIDESMNIFAVADGMGGHSHGEIASRLTIETIRAMFSSEKPTPELISSAIQKANQAVFDKAEISTKYKGMGTTITLAYFDDTNKLILGHVGDSRAYIVRENEFIQITQDHSIVAALIESGTITPAQADLHPQRSVITKALGIEPIVTPDLTEVKLLVGDRILICSDGLTSMIEDDQILDQLKKHKTPKECANNLVNLANEAGGNDNITAVVIDVKSFEQDTTPNSHAKTSAPKTHVAKTINDNPIDVERRNKTTIEEDSQFQLKNSPKGGLMFLLIIIITLLALVSTFVFILTNKFNNSYYVDVNTKNEVVVYQGIKDSPLFWTDVKTYKNTHMQLDETSQKIQLQVENNITFDSKAKANEFVKGLK